MNGLEVTRDPDLWQDWLGEIGGHDPRDTAGYARIATRLDPGAPLLVRFTAREGTVLLPLLQRPVGPSEPGRFDLTTPYDFGGHLVRCAPPDAAALLQRFTAAWTDWCREQGAVCEFLRLHPFRFPAAAIAAVQAEFHQDHVVVALDEGHEAARRGYSASCRRNLQRGLAAGLRLEPLHADESAGRRFADLYGSTMRRRRAPRYYHFDPPFFADLLAHLSGVHAFEVRDGDRGVAAALFLACGGDLFYFLGASLEDALPLRPNNVLFDGVIGWACTRGFRRLHLGGGSPELLRFKGGFSPRRVPFYLRRVVHDAAAYERLSRRLPAEVAAALPAHFPRYRAGQFMPYPADAP